MKNELNYDKLREMIARCEWKFAKTMPFAPHEYILRNKCPLTDEEFVYFIDMQRRYGVKERWGKYNNPYLYIDDYKYWTMGASYEETTVINRTKACVVEDVHELYDGIENVKKENDMEENRYVQEYISKKLGLTEDNKAFNLELINGRLKEIADCVSHLERMRTSYCCEFMQDWSKQLSADFPDCKKSEDLRPGDIMFTGITIPYKENAEAIAIRIQVEKRSLYYGLTYMPETKAMRSELQEAMSFINESNDFIKGSDWLYYKYVSYNEGYEKLKELIERIWTKN